MTPREKRKRQKRRNDVRKVHRFGFSDVDGSRYDQWSLCGKAVNARNGKGSRAVPDAAFSWLPRAAQCNSCVGAYPHGTHEHLMAVELLVAMLQRLWAARLEVGHRCYMRIGGRCIDGAQPAQFYEPRCTCGEFSIIDVHTFGILACRYDRMSDSTDRVAPEDADIGWNGERPVFGNWCKQCLRVVGEMHKLGCTQPQLTAMDIRDCETSPSAFSHFRESHLGLFKRAREAWT